MQSRSLRNIALVFTASVLLSHKGQCRTGRLPQPASAAVDRYSILDLREKAAALRAKAQLSPSGVASETLEKYPQHFTMLAYRNKSGGAEVHANFADVFIVQAGSATLETGGTVVDPKQDTPGETRGSSLRGGHSRQLHPGDIVHIPAGVPHRVSLQPGARLMYFVIKIQETSPPS